MLSLPFVRVLVAGLFLAGCCLACTNEVDLLEEGEPLPVVYGLFNRSSGEQTLSLTKTFIYTDGGGALEAAKNPEAVYWNPEEVSVGVQVRRTGQEIRAERINLADAGVERENGVFPVDPNYVYRYDISGLEIQTGDIIDLLIARNGAPLASGQARVLPELSFQKSRPLLERYSFTAKQDFTTRWSEQLRFPGSDTLKGELIQAYEVGFNIAFEEISPAGNKQRVIYWPAARDLDASPVARFNMNGLFGFLASKLEASPDIRRRFKYVQLVITAADGSFLSYQELLRANSGITSTQELPPFSNIEGGLGLYGGISQLLQDTTASLVPDSFDELFKGEQTKELNFFQ